MNKKNKKIVLFYPHVPKAAADAVKDVLDTRWIGQGRLADLFRTREIQIDINITNPSKFLDLKDKYSIVESDFLL